MPYALFQDGKQISKPHSTREACAMEAFERGLVITMHKDMVGDFEGTVLADGYEIRETEKES